MVRDYSEPQLVIINQQLAGITSSFSMNDFLLMSHPNEQMKLNPLGANTLEVIKT